MPDDGHSTGCSDNQQKTFDNQNSMMGPDGQQQIGPKSMMGNDGKKIVCLTICKVIGQDGKENAAPRSMMGENGQDVKDKACGCQNSVKGDQGQDGQQKTCGCQNDQQKTSHRSMKSQDGQQNSWNNGQKSIEGDSGKDGQQNSWNDGKSQ
jgi:hypothetical protein